MRIVIFSGAAEGRALSRELAAKGAEVTVCVATEYGREEQGIFPGVTVRAGRLEADGMAELMRGAGLSDEGLVRKRNAVAKALRVNTPDPGDPLDVLAKVGGFDLAGLCGVFLGGAIHRVPVLVDGAISAAAALCAVRLAPAAGQAVIATHLSAEPAGKMLLEALGKRPFLTAGMRLGEGTGAVAAIPPLDMAGAVYAEGGSFDDCGIPAYHPFS